MAFVTTLLVLTTTGERKFVLQTADVARFVVDSKVNPASLVGHVKTTLAPERMMASTGKGLA
jgi:hypothetical protein